MEDITTDITYAIKDNEQLLCQYDILVNEMSFMVNLLKLNKDTGTKSMIEHAIGEIRLLADKMTEIVHLRTELLEHVNTRALQRTVLIDEDNNSNSRHQEGLSELVFDLTNDNDVNQNINTTDVQENVQEEDNVLTHVSLYNMVVSNQSSSEITIDQTPGNTVVNDLMIDSVTLPSNDNSENQNQDLLAQDQPYQRYSIFNNVDTNIEVTNEANVPSDIDRTVVINRQEYSNSNNELDNDLDNELDYDSSSDNESYDSSRELSFGERLMFDIDLTDPNNARQSGYYIKKRPKLKSKFISKKVACDKSLCNICYEEYKSTDMITFGFTNKDNKNEYCHSFCLNCSLSTMRAGFTNAPYDRFHHCPLCRVNVDSVEFSYTRDEGDSKSVFQTNKVRSLKGFCGRRCINLY